MSVSLAKAPLTTSSDIAHLRAWARGVGIARTLECLAVRKRYNELAGIRHAR